MYFCIWLYENCSNTVLRGSSLESTRPSSVQNLTSLVAKDSMFCSLLALTGTVIIYISHVCLKISLYFQDGHATFKKTRWRAIAESTILGQLDCRDFQLWNHTDPSHKTKSELFFPMGSFSWRWTFHVACLLLSREWHMQVSVVPRRVGKTRNKNLVSIMQGLSGRMAWCFQNYKNEKIGKSSRDGSLIHYSLKVSSQTKAAG